MVYKWYILPIGGLYGNYHLLREPGNSIDTMGFSVPFDPTKDQLLGEFSMARPRPQVASTFWLVNQPTWIPRLSRYKKIPEILRPYPYHPCMVYLPIYIWLIFMVNVGKYTIHGSYGLWSGTVCFHWLCRWIKPKSTTPWLWFGRNFLTKF